MIVRNIQEWWQKVRPSILWIDDEGWLYGPNVKRVPAHPSWYYDSLSTMNSLPLAIVAHYTATAPGTARSMARRRKRARAREDRAASWHVTVASNGVIWQMVPFTAGAWHAGSRTARPIPGTGMKANRCSIGVELEGHGVIFPDAQVEAAKGLWRALVHKYSIPQALAMVEHSKLDPTRRRDPGPIWMRDVAPEVLDYAFRGTPSSVGV